MKRINENELYRMVKVFSVILTASSETVKNLKIEVKKFEWNYKIDTLTKLREIYISRLFRHLDQIDDQKYFKNDKGSDIQIAFWGLQYDEREAIFLAMCSRLSAADMARICNCLPGVVEARAKAATLKLISKLDDISGNIMTPVDTKSTIEEPPSHALMH